MPQGQKIRVYARGVCAFLYLPRYIVRMTYFGTEVVQCKMLRHKCLEGGRELGGGEGGREEGDCCYTVSPYIKVNPYNANLS